MPITFSCVNHKRCLQSKMKAKPYINQVFPSSILSVPNQIGENMKHIIVGIAVAGLMVAGSAMATDMPDLAKKNGCTACHTIDKKVVLSLIHI